MPHQYYKASERGMKNTNWLQSNFIFSFSSYQNPTQTGFGLLKAFNDDFVQPGFGFGLHPHTNMEIISVMLHGSMNHKDSMGYAETVTKDWVQIMSAGSGLRHEEYNVGTDEVNFLQIWIEPKLQNITPRYQRRFFPEQQRINQLTTIVSNQEGTEHCWINQNAQLCLGYYTLQTTIEYPINHPNKGVFIFCISGNMVVNEQTLQARDAIGVWHTTSVLLQCLPQCRFLLIETPINH